MSLDEKLVKDIYAKYKGVLSGKTDIEKVEDSLQYQSYKDLDGQLTLTQFDILLHKFVEITVDTFADRNELPPKLKEEWIAAGSPPIRKFVWDKWSKEVYKFIDHEDEPRRIFVALDCIT